MKIWDILENAYFEDVRGFVDQGKIIMKNVCKVFKKLLAGIILISAMHINALWHGKRLS